MDGNWNRLKKGSGSSCHRSEAGMRVSRQGGKNSGTTSTKSQAPTRPGDRQTGHQEGPALGFLMKI